MKICIKYLISIILALLACEGISRIYFRCSIHYPIEAWRYGSQFKQAVGDERMHIHVPGSKGSIMDKEVAINGDGFRNPEISAQKPDGVYRILSVGDSFTFGFGVNQSETFTALIADSLPPNKEIINTGVGNYNTRQELAFLKTKGMSLNPDHVLLNFYINDAEEFQKKKGCFLSRHSYLYVFAISMVQRVKTYVNPERQYKNIYQKLYKGENWEKYISILARFVEFTQSKNIKLTVVLLPDLRQLTPYPFKEVHAKLAVFLNSKGIDTVDLYESFKGKKENELWVAKDDHHPNARAHAIIAKEISKRLKYE